MKNRIKQISVLVLFGLSLCAVHDVSAWPPWFGVAGKPFGGGGGGGGSGSTWADWNETVEAGWGSSNANICLMEGSLGANETSVGVLTGDDLVYTQHGVIAATSGSPSKRKLDASDDYFNVTTAFVQGTIGASTSWNVIIKVDTLATNQAGPDDRYIVSFRSGTYYVELVQTDANKLKLRCHDGDIGASETTTSSAMPTTGVLYIGMWADGGVNKIRFGFKEDIKPVKWSDFAATKRGEDTHDGDFTDKALTVGQIGGRAIANSYLNAYLYYVVVAKECLINNGG